jgi:hypothetical protein
VQQQSRLKMHHRRAPVFTCFNFFLPHFWPSGRRFPMAPQVRRRAEPPAPTGALPRARRPTPSAQRRAS